MINSIKTRTPILALILFVFSVSSAFAGNKVVVIPLGANTQHSVAAYYGGENWFYNISTATVTASVTVNAASSGVIIANASASILFDLAANEASCSLSTSTTFDYNYTQYVTSSGGLFRGGMISSNRHFAVNAGAHTINLVCERSLGADYIDVGRPQLSLLFIPD